MTETSTSSTLSPRYLDTYNKLVVLNRDLYYKRIISAHKETIVRKVQSEIDDIYYCYKMKYISKKDMFSKIEALRCKNSIIDNVVYENINYARKTFCSPRKGGRTRFSNKRK